MCVRWEEEVRVCKTPYMGYNICYSFSPLHTSQIVCECVSVCIMLFYGCLYEDPSTIHRNQLTLSSLYTSYMHVVYSIYVSLSIAVIQRNFISWWTFFLFLFLLLSLMPFIVERSLLTIRHGYLLYGIPNVITLVSPAALSAKCEI